MEVIYSLLVLFFGLIFLTIGGVVKQARIERERLESIRMALTELSSGVRVLTPTEFMWLRTQKTNSKGRPLYSNHYNIPGVYILHNNDNDQYYIGQGIKVLDRVNDHFNGRGNGDVYADYKYGANWSIRVVSLDSSNFHTLNQLEREYINHYDSYQNGYNKTRGNNG